MSSTSTSTAPSLETTTTPVRFTRPEVHTLPTFPERRSSWPQRDGRSTTLPRSSTTTRSLAYSLSRPSPSSPRAPPEPPRRFHHRVARSSSSRRRCLLPSLMASTVRASLSLSRTFDNRRTVFLRPDQVALARSNELRSLLSRNRRPSLSSSLGVRPSSSLPSARR